MPEVTRSNFLFSLIVRLYKRFKQEGVAFERPRAGPSESRAASSASAADTSKRSPSDAPSSRTETSEAARFEEDLKKALQLSLEEEQRRKAATSQTRSLYGTLTAPAETAVVASAPQSGFPTSTASVHMNFLTLRFPKITHARKLYDLFINHYSFSF